MRVLERFSFGVGDRFGLQAKAQLRAFQALARHGIEVVPVWNKSNREHLLIGSEPQGVYDAAHAAVTEAGWSRGWHVDADHIRVDTVDRFLGSSDFFTMDVADRIGKPAAPAAVRTFVDRHPELIGTLEIPGIAAALPTDRAAIERVASKYLLAVQEAGRIHRHIASKRGEFIAEVSMDETDSPQTPPELLVILVALADEGVPLQTIAPKFTGRFHKGVDYVGDLARFEQELHEDLAVIAHAVRSYSLPSNLKLSIHSGSDKFRLYPILRKAIDRTGAGLHLKTAGTTWLEELIGLAEAGGEGLAFAKEIYVGALDHLEELTEPYATVIDIDRKRLPAASTARSWTSSQFVRALRHVPADPEFNPSVRQLLHVSFKLAARRGGEYLDLLRKHEEVVGKNVTENIFERHLRPLFLN